MGKNKYVNLTDQKVETPRRKLGDQSFKVENFDQRQVTSQTMIQTVGRFTQAEEPHDVRISHPNNIDTAKHLPIITGRSRIEYVNYSHYTAYAARTDVRDAPYPSLPKDNEWDTRR